MVSTLLVDTRQVLAAEAMARLIDGRQGRNRGTTCQIDANDDLDAVFKWIAARGVSSKTRQVFLSETRRLYYWLFYLCGKPLSSLTTTDLESYRAFLRDPDKRWIGPRTSYLMRTTGRLNPRWRPFEKPLNETHITHVVAVLRSLFGYLMETGYLVGNPTLGLRNDRKGQMGDNHMRRRSVTERALTEEQWELVLSTVEIMPQTSDAERRRYERARFVLQLFYHLGARLTEIATHRMGHFAAHEECWWWDVVGKGGKHRRVAVNSALLAALERYRAHLATVNPSLGLTPLPSPGETHPIVFDLDGRRPISARQLYTVVKDAFRAAAERCMSDDPAAAVLRAASPHWIRHATATHLANMAETMPELRQVQNHMRHASLNTTLMYTHIEDQAATAFAERLARRPRGR